ncbi:hypothetical protein MATL_G00186270 [Megalops atlanticus]|uniref:Cold-shock domain-containing protein n=1 Tax=Megalops atlanticus TaxID=7932 RepID=A0A9D3PMF0_MEGAT|nr:hypothetical protein MATL_G00186270 [Megalops atlanticus]
MNRDFGQIGNSKRGPVGDRDFGPICEFGPVDRNYTPGMNERDFGSMMLSERGPGSVNYREFYECQEERGVFFDDQRAFPGPPDQDVGVTMCHDPRTMQQPGWVDTSGIPLPGLNQANQINPRMPEPPKPEPPRGEQPKPPASKKSRPSHNTGSTKPPPGRFQGVISFVGSDYGFIERDDLKKIFFSFDSFWGDTAEMLPGVQVQFTLYKEMGKEYATDVVVPPGGTEEVDSEIFQGVISKVPDLPGEGKPRKGPPPKYTGCIQATLYSGSTELPFGPQDSKPTLLLNDHVQFNLVTNLVTKQKRAINIELLPETFQFTSESREMGVVMSMKDGSGSIMSEQWGKICFDANENLDDADLSIVDEVDFTVVPTNGLDQQKAVRVRKLPEGTVTFGSKTREKIAEVIRMEGPSASLTLEKGKWKPVTSEVLPQRTVVFEDVSSEQYEGTVIKAIRKVSDRKQVDSEPDPRPGLLVTRFNISTNRGTKVECATNIEILPDTFSQSKEQREKGVVVDLRESFGFIKCQRDPRLFFHLREVMEESKLNLMDEVELTVLSSESAGEGDQAVRIRKLLWTAFTATPKLEGLGTTGKEKKKMTIKLLRDSVNEEMKNLKVKIESFSTEDFPQDPAEPLDEECSSGKPDDISSVSLKSKSAPPPAEVEAEQKGEGRHRERSRSAERRWSSQSWRQRSPAGEHTRGRSRSHSRERGHRRRSDSRERAANQARRRSRSRSPGRDGGSRRKGSTNDAHARHPIMRDRSREVHLGQSAQELPRHNDILDDELVRKKRELELLEEQIARKRAIIAMEQKGLTPKVHPKEEQDYDSHLPTDNGYYRCRLPLESGHDTPLKDVRPAPGPIKSILKKRAEPFESDNYLQTEFTKKPSLNQNFLSQSHLDQPHGPKSNISTQFDRFLQILNKGVDVNLLTTLVRETRKETAAYEKQAAHQLPQNEVTYKDRDPYKDSYGRRPEEQEDLGESGQDFLLPHERACQDGIGFSRIVGMKHRVQEEEPYWKEGDVEDEERFLYGERAFADEDEQETSAPPDRRQRGPSPPWPAVEKPLSVADSEDKMQHYDKIQSLLQTIGLELDTAEVSKLTDRTRERLYGKKLKAKPPGSADREWERRRSQTGSPESEPARSVSPVQSSRREVYMTYSSILEHGSAHNQRRSREVHIDSRTVQHTQDSVSPSAAQYPHTSSESYPTPSGSAREGAKQVKELPTTKSRCLRVIKTVNLRGQVSQNKGAVSALKEVPLTEQSSAPSPGPLPASSEVTEKMQVATISEDEIKAKQKKRLEQFNERMRLKKEQQKEALWTRAESQKVPPGKTCTEVKNVWICGHSLVFWAEKRAKSPEYGKQLGMDSSCVRVWWKGMQGMTWEQLLPLLLKLKGSWPNPDVIILHLGGNDLGKTDPKGLLAAIKRDLTSLKSIFPQCLLVWSDILPRRSWRTTEDAEAMESIRVSVNRKVQADIAELGGAALTHDQIRPGSDAGLYRPDGVHLSGKGIDTFNADMQDFLEKWETKLNETASQS